MASASPPPSGKGAPPTKDDDSKKSSSKKYKKKHPTKHFLKPQPAVPKPDFRSETEDEKPADLELAAEGADLAAIEVVQPPSIVYTAKELLKFREANLEAPEQFPTSLDFPCIADDVVSLKPKADVGAGEAVSPTPVSAYTSGSKAKPELVPLSVSENRWKREEASGVKLLVRKLTSILNKLTVDKFDSLCSKFVELVADVRSFEVLEQVVELVHDKALSEMNFGDMYPRLCEVLCAKMSAVLSFDGTTRITFRRVLLEQCQSEFSSSVKVAEELDKISGDILNDDGVESRLKQKARLLGHAKFLGELYIRGIVTFKIIRVLISHYLRDYRVVPSITDMECLCALFTTCGKALESDPEMKRTRVGRQSLMDQWMALLEKASLTSIPTRIRFSILEVLELRGKNWVPRRQTLAAGKISGGRNDASVPDPRFSKAATERTFAKKSDRPSRRQKFDRYSDPSRFKVAFVSEFEQTKQEVAAAKELDVSEDFLFIEVSEEEKRKFVSAAEEYLVARDPKEIEFVLKDSEIDPSVRNAYFISSCFVIGLEKEADQILFGDLVASAKFFSSDDVYKASVISLLRLNELIDDLPVAPARLAHTLKTLIKSGKISPELMLQAKTLALSEEPDAPEAITKVFDLLKDIVPQ